LGDTEFKINLDPEMIWQGEKEKEKIKSIWKEITSNGGYWRNIEPKFEELLKLGGLLPIVFKIKFEDLEIEVIDGECTFYIVAKDFKKLKEFNKILIEEDNLRITPVGRKYFDNKSDIEKIN
jgi:hypothetical protein